jgi:hypothetical protein
LATLREQKQFMTEHGFRLHRDSGPHYIWRDDHGNQQTTSRTPSDHRSWENEKARIRRCVRDREARAAQEAEAARAPKALPGGGATTRLPTGRRVLTTKPTVEDFIPPAVAKLLTEEAPAKPVLTPLPAPVPTTDYQKRAKGYDPLSREVLHLRVRELFQAGQKDAALAETLNAEGFRTTEGGFFTAANVGMIRNRYLRLLRRAGRNGPVRSVPVPPPQPTPEPETQSEPQTEAKEFEPMPTDFEKTGIQTNQEENRAAIARLEAQKAQAQAPDARELRAEILRILLGTYSAEKKVRMLLILLEDEQ